MRLSGGLGNQMFQYALGRRLSIAQNVPLKFDVSIYQNPRQYRSYKLFNFTISGSPANSWELYKFLLGKKIPSMKKMYNFMEDRKPYYKRRIVKEANVIFDPNILLVRADVYLDGYWQSEKYFKEIRDILVDEFQLCSPLDIQNEQIIEKIRSTNSVSMHIRRGDYITDKFTAADHGALSLNYYHKAIDVMRNRVSMPLLFIFSDDIVWVKQNLTVDIPSIYVDINSAETDYKDFYLMSLCQHHIIANSSFSWWAAWLSTNSEKKVIAPSQWYLSGQSTQDLIPEEWIKI